MTFFYVEYAIQFIQNTIDTATVELSSKINLSGRSVCEYNLIKKTAKPIQKRGSAFVVKGSLNVVFFSFF